MVSHIGIALAVGSAPPASQPMRACAAVPAVLSRRDHFLVAILTGGTGPPEKAKSLAETAETPPFGSPYTVGKNYLAWRAGSAVRRKLKAPSGGRFGEEFRCR
jgi:hypothetical protein